MTNSQSALQSIFLKNLPDGTPLPQNYVIQVQAELPSTGSGGFAIFFHTQVNPNPYNGYLFDIQPSGAWAGYSLDAGQETVLHSDQGIALSATSFTTIDVVVSGDQYMIFLTVTTMVAFKVTPIPVAPLASAWMAMPRSF